MSKAGAYHCIKKGLSTFSWCFSIFFRCFLRFHQLFWESFTFSWCCTGAPSSSGVHRFFLEFFFFFRCCKRNTGFFFSFTRLSGSSPPFFGTAKKLLSFPVFTGFFRSSPLFPGVSFGSHPIFLRAPLNHRKTFPILSALFDAFMAALPSQWYD